MPALDPIHYRQTLLQVGQPPLHGLVSEPTLEPVRTPVLVLLNPGELHHVGNCELNVRISRRMNAEGFPAVRFDFSGIGDSPARTLPDAPGYQLAAAQLTEVLDHLEARWGWNRFVVGGLCAASDNAFEAATTDTRIVGLIQIDPYVFRTPKWYVKHYLPRLFSAQSWLNRLRPLLPGRATVQRGLPKEYLERSGNIGRLVRSKPDVEDGYRELIARNVKIIAIMTRGQLDYYNYLGQFREMFSGVDFGDNLVERFYPLARHIITEPEDQAAITDDIAQWCTQFEPSG